MQKSNLAAVVLSMGLLTPAFAADWGDLKIKFQATGPVKAAAKIDVNKDQAFCGKHGLKDESLVIAKDGSVANVFVYLYVGRGGKKPPVHPDYAKAAKANVNLDNKNCRFEPHVLTVRTGQTLLIGNPDPVGHNSKVDTYSNPPINPIIPAGGVHKKVFTLPERLPAKVSCSIHAWMNSWIIVQDHPYMGVTDKTGAVTIKNVPAGKWTYQVWHEKAGYVQDVTFGGKTTKWKRGRPTFTIKKGMNDLGTVKVATKIFSK